MSKLEQEAQALAEKKQKSGGGFGEFMYNSKEGTCMGRTPSSWVQITVFYIIFYGLLAGFFAIMLAVFLQTLNDQHPKWYGKESIMSRDSGNGWGPGMGFQPKPKDGLSTLIWLKENDQKGKDDYVDQMQETYDEYINASTNAALQDCTSGRADESKACKFDVQQELSGCGPSDNFGFDNNQPCVFLRINKIYGWKPEGYDDDVPEELTNYLEQDGERAYDPSNVYVVCDGQDPVDRENIGSVKIYPENGISSVYFPYENQEGYQAPIVAAKFTNPRRGTLINVLCRAFAKNIGFDSEDKLGGVTFEMLIE